MGSMESAVVNQTDSITFLQTLDKALRKRTATTAALGLIVASVENFDEVRSAFGHRLTMPMLASAAARLRGSIGKGDAVIRFSESKFGVLVKGLKNEGHLVLAANKILREATSAITVDGELLEPQLRLGATASLRRGDDPDTMLQQAETALLAARHENRDFLLYDKGQTGRLRNALSLATEIECALDSSEISMFYQPKIAAADRRPVGAEALMRWSSPERGFVPPDVFVPIADGSGQMESLTWFAMNAACRQLGEWPDRWGSLSVAVNVTPSIVEHTDLEELVMSVTGLWDVRADQLTIEVTENALMRPQSSFATLNALRDTGVRVSIDDFGTGYSSFSYFNSIPADELKIDKSFVTGMLDDDGYARIVRTIINLAHSFNLKVIAEGVEDERTAQALAELDCDYLQGYYFSRPLPQNEFICWLNDYRA